MLARILDRHREEACSAARDDKSMIVARMNDDGTIGMSTYRMLVAKAYSDRYRSYGDSCVQDAIKMALEGRRGRETAARVQEQLERHFDDTSKRMLGEVGGPHVAELQATVRESLENRSIALKRDLKIELDRRAANPPAVSDIFLSHAALDQPLVTVLVSEIERLFPDRNVFVASRPGDIQAGQKWLPEIERHLKQQGTLIVLVTPNSVSRPWLWFEIGASWFVDPHEIIPVCLGLGKGDVPAPLSSRQILALDVPLDLAQLFRQLGREHDGDLGRFVNRLRRASETVAVLSPADPRKAELLSSIYQVRMTLGSLPHEKSEGEKIRGVSLWSKHTSDSIRALAASFGMTAANQAAEAHRHLATVADLASQVQRTPRNKGFDWSHFDWVRWFDSLGGADRCLVSLSDQVDANWRSLVF